MGDFVMKGKRYTEEQSFYRWKSKFGGMEVSDAKRLRELEAENSRLKKLLAEAELNKSMLRDVLSKKW
jgi:putative transposase